MGAAGPRVRPAALPATGRVRFRHRARLAAEILTLYVPCWRALRSGRPLAEYLAVVRAPLPGRPVLPPSQQMDLAVRLGSIVEQVLGRLPTDNRCLIRSLVLVRLLANRSIDSRLVIGVSVDAGFAAHAWVEHAGRPLLPVGHYQPLSSL